MKCKYCGKDIEDNATFCPYCGKNVEENEILEQEDLEKEKKEVVNVNPVIPVLGLVASIILYISCFLSLKLHDYIKAFGDYVVFLLLVPLGILGMICSSLGRHLSGTRSQKIMSWVSFGVLILDYVLLLACIIRFIG